MIREIPCLVDNHKHNRHHDSLNDIKPVNVELRAARGFSRDGGRSKRNAGGAAPSAHSVDEDVSLTVGVIEMCLGSKPRFVPP